LNSARPDGDLKVYILRTMTSITSAGAIQSAQLGISRGLSALDRDAATVASASTGIQPTQELTTALIDASQQKLNVEASVKALSIADEALSDAMGRLVDTRA